MISTASPMAPSEPIRPVPPFPTAFVGPEGTYPVLLEVNVHRPLTDSSSNLSGLSSALNSLSALGLNSNSASAGPSTTLPLSNPNPAGSSATLAGLNQAASAPTPGTATPAAPPVYIPATPGVPANADGINPSVAPPAHPSCLDTIVVRFPPAQAPNLFPHPGFLTGTKYGRPKDTPAEVIISEPGVAVDQNDSVHLSDDPASQQSSMATAVVAQTTHSPTNQLGGVIDPSSRINLSPAQVHKGRGSPFSSSSAASPVVQLSPRPRAAFKGSTSTFIKSSDGLPLPHSVLKTLYTPSADTSRAEPEERTFGFYTWNKTLFWTQLCGARAIELARLNFQACPTCVAVNRSSASAASLDVLVGFSSGDLIYFDPLCARYTRLNKGGCVSNSSVSKVVWLPRTGFVSAHVDGTMIGWDKEREDCNGFIPEPWPALESDLDVRAQAMVCSQLPSSLAPDKRHKLNPISHWRLSRKAVRDLAFSPDSQHCAVVSEDGCLRVIDVASERILDTYVSYFGALLCVCWSSDGRLIFTGGQDDLVTVYAPLDQRVVARCQGHASFVSGVAYDPWMSDERSSRFASVSDDCKLIFWDLSSASLSRPRLNTQHSNNSRRQSTTSNVSLPRRRAGETFHPAPGQNEVAILQPVMLKEIGVDPLSGIKFCRDRVAVVSRSGQLRVFGRPRRRKRVDQER